MVVGISGEKVIERIGRLPAWELKGKYVGEEGCARESKDRKKHKKQTKKQIEPTKIKKGGNKTKKKKKKKRGVHTTPPELGPPPNPKKTGDQQNKKKPLEHVAIKDSPSLQSTWGHSNRSTKETTEKKAIDLGLEKSTLDERAKERRGGGKGQHK